MHCCWLPLADDAASAVETAGLAAGGEDTIDQRAARGLVIDSDARIGPAELADRPTADQQAELSNAAIFAGAELGGGSGSLPIDQRFAFLRMAHFDARFTRGCDADEFILNSGGLRPNFDTRNPTAAGEALCSIKGRKLPLGSPWLVNGSVNWENEVGSGMTLVANANFSYEASKFVQVDNLAETGSTFLLNGR